MKSKVLHITVYYSENTNIAVASGGTKLTSPKECQRKVMVF